MKPSTPSMPRSIRRESVQWRVFAVATPARRDEGTFAAAILMAAILLSGYFLSSPVVLWAALAPGLWLAATHPARLVQLLAVTAPTFPVIRIVRDIVGSQQVSTKGLFLSCDDPIVASLGVAWILAHMRSAHKRTEWFPAALVWLLALYPVINFANIERLDSSQTIVSLLYYMKWSEYAILLFLVPQTIRGEEAIRLLSSLGRIMMGVLLVSALFASYEIVESVRTGSYTKAATMPRASAFFGTLDPARFGASEDPVNFGVYVMVAGSIALAIVSASRRSGWLPSASFLGGLLALLLSASRAPWVAAAVAFGKINRLGSSRVMLGVLAVMLAVTATVAFAPQVWQASFARVEALSNWQYAAEQSAQSRLQIALNSPVFTVDTYWLIGHGHSSYRFIAEEHLSRVTAGVSRSLYNFGLTAWYDAGPIGVGCWVVLFLQLRKRIAQIQQRSPLPAARIFAKGLSGALWGLAAAAMFGEVPYSWRVMGVFYLATGVCLAADHAARAAVARLAWEVRQ